MSGPGHVVGGNFSIVRGLFGNVTPSITITGTEANLPCEEVVWRLITDAQENSAERFALEQEVAKLRTQVVDLQLRALGDSIISPQLRFAITEGTRTMATGLARAARAVGATFEQLVTPVK